MILPREKIEMSGPQALTDAELIAVLLGTGIRGKGVLAVARGVVVFLKRRIEQRSDYGWRELAGLEGVGRVKAMQIVCALEFGRRLFSSIESRSVIKCRKDVEFLMGDLKKNKQEHVVALYLNARNELVGRATVAVGAANLAVVTPRDVFAEGIALGAVNLILVHNHPSGNPTMSQEDRAFSLRVKNAGELLGIRLVDHVVV